MRSTQAISLIAMKVLVEKYIVTEIRIGLELVIVPKHGAPLVFVAQAEPHQAARDFLRYFPQVHHPARTGRTFNYEFIPIIVIEAPQTLDYQVVDRQPDRSAP